MKPTTPADHKSIEKINEIYVAVFPVPLPGESSKVETILAGYQQDPENPTWDRVRATVETNVSAVPDLIDMCDSIVEQQEEISSFRLLKFDSSGIHEMDPDDFRFPHSLMNNPDPAASWGHLC